MTTYPPERFVEVVWSDAYSDKPSKSFTVEDVTHADIDNLPVITRGWLLREDEKGVSIAPEVYFLNDEQKWNYRGKTFILKSMILGPVNDYPPKRKHRVVKSPQPRKPKPVTHTVAEVDTLLMEAHHD